MFVLPSLQHSCLLSREEESLADHAIATMAYFRPEPDLQSTVSFPPRNSNPILSFPPIYN
jgi:hypothetical protein